MLTNTWIPLKKKIAIVVTMNINLFIKMGLNVSILVPLT
jgi:hypothetical protein